MPSFRALQAEVVPQQVRGKEFGRIQGFFNLGAIFGPIIGGLLFDIFLNVQFVIPLPSLDITLFGPTVMFVTTAFLSITGAILIARWVPNKSLS
jgi:MFS family permease